MNTGIIASRYATALLRLVQETGNGEVAARQARIILQALASVPDLRRVVEDTTAVTSEKKLALFEAAVTSSGEKALAPEMRKFIGLIIKNGRIGDITLALKSFEDQYYQSLGIIRGRLVLSSEPDKAAENLEIKLKKLIEAKTGKTLLLTTEVDESLIGGFLLEVEDKLLDASVSRQLDVIRRQFVERNRRIV